MKKLLLILFCLSTICSYSINDCGAYTNCKQVKHQKAKVKKHNFTKSKYKL